MCYPHDVDWGVNNDALPYCKICYVIVEKEQDELALLPGAYKKKVKPRKKRKAEAPAELTKTKTKSRKKTKKKELEAPEVKVGMTVKAAGTRWKLPPSDKMYFGTILSRRKYCGVLRHKVVLTLPLTQTHTHTLTLTLT